MALSQQPSAHFSKHLHRDENRHACKGDHLVKLLCL